MSMGSVAPTRRVGFVGLGLALLLGLAASAVAHAQGVQPTSGAPRAAMEAGAAAEVQRVVDAQRRIEGQGKDVAVRARIQGDTLTLNLSAEYVPATLGAEFEDLLHELATVAQEWIRERNSHARTPIRHVRFLLGGRDIYDYFPEQRPRPPRAKKTSGAVAGTVVVSAGHGIYFHYGFNDWRAQRDPSNGITEDFVTPDFAGELQTWLTARSGATVLFPRSTGATTHTPSGEPWWKLGARYHLQDQYPNDPQIWNSRPNDRTNLRERNEDIVSRPLFANHIAADTLISLHTNAGPASATGTRAIFHSGRADDQELADNILCYMEELIHAKQGYEQYRVPRRATGRTDLGENREATMPAVVVEVGFHTNASDAAALQDPVFRTAAMKGVEKGARLVNETIPCQHFEIDSIPPVSGPQNAPIRVETNFKGYPEFAVEATVQVVLCPAGWTCSGGTVSYANKVPSPLAYTFTCTTPTPQPTATFRLRTTLKDVDDVKPEPVEHEVTCTQAAVGASGVAVPTFSIGSI